MEQKKSKEREKELFREAKTIEGPQTRTVVERERVRSRRIFQRDFEKEGLENQSIGKENTFPNRGERNESERRKS